MSRLAYIISAYKDPEHLKHLIEALDDNADFYIHVDLKVDIEPFYKLLKDKVFFIKRSWISWGGWKQVEYQKHMLEAVINSGKEYSHIVCLSAQDYPLWSNHQIHEFFDKNRDTEFIKAVDITNCNMSRQLSKIKVYHFFRDLGWNSLWWKNKMIVASRIIMKTLPIRKKSTTIINNKPAHIFFGSDYWAITLPCAKYVVDKLNSEKEMVKYFQTSFAPSELCIQTIVFNSPFAEKALLYKEKKFGLLNLTPLHFLYYGKQIKVFTINDLDTLYNSGRMFCRKVESLISDELIKEIDKMRK